MASVVFLRGVNVGGTRVFRPSALAASLSDLDVESLGAVGTFVVRTKVAQSTLRRRILDELPFEAVVIIVPGERLARFADGRPAGRIPAGAKPFLSVLSKRPATVPKGRIERPEGRPWQVRVGDIEPPFVLSWQRGTAGARLYPNEVVEKVLGVPATTRGWATVGSILKTLGE